MRLGQLSRKVNVKPNEILNYLKLEFDVELGTHLNTKVEDALVDKVVAKFNPIPEPSKPEENVTPVAEETHSEIIESAPQETSVTEDTISDENDSGTDAQESESVAEFEVHEEVDASTIANAPLIKAEKVELALKK